MQLRAGVDIRGSERGSRLVALYSTEALGPVCWEFRA